MAGILSVHLPKEGAGEAHVNSAILLPARGFLVHGHTMVARNEHALSFSHVYLPVPVVEHHLARQDIVHGVFSGTVHARIGIVIEKAEKHILVIEYDFHGVMA